ncbi:MAG TPA: AEC family transporter [Tepidiformaceae bacterium]
MLHVLFDVILPVALVAACGGLVGRWKAIPVAPISTLVFYLFSPALVLHSLATTQLSAGASFRIFGVMIATYAAMYVAATAWSLLVRHDRSMRAGFALAATIPNVGNMGLPVAQLAFGTPGLEVAVMNFIAGSALANSASIVVASTAGGSRAEAFRAPFRYPALYAAAAGAAINAFGIDLPVAINAPITTLSNAAVPAMLVVLGLQLQHAVSLDHLTDLVAVNSGRLLIAPVVAWFTATALGLSDVTRGTLVVLAAMPTAVIATILATEFNAQPAFVTRAVVTSTLASMLSLTVLITLVQ